MGRGHVDERTRLTVFLRGLKETQRQKRPALRIRKSLKSKVAIFKDQFFTPQKKQVHWDPSIAGSNRWFLGWDIFMGDFFVHMDSWHILGDRLIPEQPLWVDRVILHVGPAKSLTFSRVFPKGCHGLFGFWRDLQGGANCETIFPIRIGDL